MNELFINRLKEYFGDDHNKFLEMINKDRKKSFLLNNIKTDKKNILDIIDFEIEENIYNSNVYNYKIENIGKTKAYELGLIYPQDVSSTIFSKYLKKDNVNIVLDLCCAPGGKTINLINELKELDFICICNDINYKRALSITNNIERLGFDNCIITNKSCDKLSNELKNSCDIVLLDAPCSGEGMIRRYDEILENYNIENINRLANIQKELLENAYEALNNNGQLIYSTCTYSFEEDEKQIQDFLNRHPDMKLIPIDIKGNHSKLDGTIKLSPINDCEGQFIAIMIKNNIVENKKFKYLKDINEKLVIDFIKENLNECEYYLYKHNDNYYISSKRFIDLNNNVLRYGTLIGNIINKRFEPSHSFYRSNYFRNYFKNIIDLNDEEYELFISGKEIRKDIDDSYYLITYKGLSLGFSKASKNILKNKYPKGLRRVL